MYFLEILFPRNEWYKDNLNKAQTLAPLNGNDVEKNVTEKISSIILTAKNKKYINMSLPIHQNQINKKSFVANAAIF